MAKTTTNKSDYRDVIRDLDFFYNESAAVLGLRSSFPSFIARLEGLTVLNCETDPMETLDRGKVHKYNAILSILNKLPLKTRRVLDAIYNNEYAFNSWKTDWRRAENDPPPLLIKMFGKKASCALFSTHANTLEELLELLSKKQKRSLTKKDHQLSFIIGEEIDALYKRVHSDYLKARKQNR